jgi:hypothetical protein
MFYTQPCYFWDRKEHEKEKFLKTGRKFLNVPMLGFTAS